MPEFKLFPERGSVLADRVDDLTMFALAVAAFFSLLIAGLIFYFGLKYRRRRADEVGSSPARATTVLEITWSVIPLGITLFLFGWGTDVFFELSRPPADSVQYFVVGRQWMWKIQHPDGRREINELHVPVGQPIKLTMTSEDVLHSFFIPAFRTKMDVLPGRYTTLWFKADKVGTFRRTRSARSRFIAPSIAAPSTRG
jgi:cytochrome c oxidase subunit II